MLKQMDNKMEKVKAELEEEKRKGLEYAAQVARLKSILAQHDIKILFHDYGCGCCGSGVLKVEYKGEMILDNSDYSSIFSNTDFSMFEDKENENKC